MPSPRFIVRLAILVTVSLFALISMSLAAALMASASQDGPFLDIALVAPTLAIVVAILTLITAPLMIALDIVRPGVYFTSMIIFEILWLGFLSVMWLASGAAQAVENIVLTTACTVDSSDDFFDGFSDDPRPDNSLQTICGEARAIAAFGFLNWLILMFYTLTVMIMSCVAMSRKRGRVWTESFANAPLSASASAKKGPIPRSYQSSYPQVQQVQQNTGGSVQTGALHSHV
ncbi:hypothetical protein DFH08DRAFT_1025945 [Mycena albidolilacea]|uniref:MARVEL domain-containing protein n=1 Tax=Mycena albidolilacea TaxID=1033008 RepID=A0AAD6ZKS9_9AGAR|nr:hypothetical protein DFH08DRAFT_1025945 [Mycena albidolilacea]